MKALALYIAIFALVLLAVPMIAIGFDMPEPADAPVHTPAASGAESAAKETTPLTQLAGEAATNPEADAGADTQAQIPYTSKGVESFRILDETTGEVREVSLRDFVRGAVAAEMPAAFHSEALKAQAVAAHTFALHNHLAQQENPDPSLKGADFSADPTNLKVYVTEDIARSFYGEQAGIHWSKICKAADAVVDYVLEYGDEPIVAAYHAISGGVTEDAGNIWTGSAPYLKPAESVGDMLAPDYESLVTVPTEEFRIRITTAYPEIQLPADPGEWIGAISRSESGYVQDIEVGDMSFHGKDIRLLLDLRSHNFEVLHADRGFEFIVVGYGHGVGLSQYGADYMARQGGAFEEILSNYYTDAVLKKVDFEVK